MEEYPKVANVIEDVSEDVSDTNFEENLESKETKVIEESNEPEQWERGLVYKRFNGTKYKDIEYVDNTDAIVDEGDKVDLIEKEGKIGIMTNVCYGGFGISEEGKAVLKERKVKYINKYYDVVRTCRQVIELIEEQKVNMVRSFSKIYVQYIDKKYFDGPGFWRIDEYDGSERLVIDEKGYEIWRKKQSSEELHKKIFDILNEKNYDDSEKINKIKILYDSYYGIK